MLKKRGNNTRLCFYAVLLLSTRFEGVPARRNSSTGVFEVRFYHCFSEVMKLSIENNVGMRCRRAALGNMLAGAIKHFSSYLTL